MPEAYRLAQWLTGNASDAEDIVQEAAIRAFRGIKNFGAVNARAWSLTIVRNTAFSWLAKNKPWLEKHAVESGPVRAAHEEAAKMLGIKKSAASNRYIRALRRLKEALGDWPGVAP